MTTPIYLGLDLSLNSTGWAVSRGGEIETGVIIPPKGIQGVPRLLSLRSALLLLVQKKVAPNGEHFTVMLEDYAFGATGQVFGIAEWGGIARLTLAQVGNNTIYSTSPGTLKKFVTGKGSAKKEQMLLAVFRRWGREFATNDEADAFGLMKMLEEEANPEQFPQKLLYETGSSAKVASAIPAPPRRFS